MAKLESHRIISAQIHVVTPMNRESEIFLDIKKDPAR
jgi:hypothetical protein